jgi:RNA polymerase sigma factor (sigma-70 family)
VTLPEQQLIQQLRERNELAFRQLVHEQKDRVYNVALGVLRDEEEAEDVAQEVFIEILESIRHFKGESRLSTWIYRITITQSLEVLRKRKRKKRFGFMIRLFQGSVGNIEADVPDFVHPGVQLENKEKAAILFKAIDMLPENQRIAFTLHKLEDLSYDEIAEVMNVTLSSVESLIHRARVNLQKKLAGLRKF